MKNRISSVERQRIILQYLKGRVESDGLTCKQITEKLHNEENIIIDERNVRRDLDKLSRNHGICASEEKPFRFFMSEDFGSQYKLELNYPTLQALIIALNNLKATSHSYFVNVTTEAETAILENLGDDIAERLRADKDRYYYDYSAGRPSKSEIKDFEKVMYAIRENYIFTCENHSPGKDELYNRRTRRFAPYIFVLSSGFPYVICQDMDDLQFKTLSTARIKKVEIVKERFTPVDFKEHIKLEHMIGGYGGINNPPVGIEVHGDKVMGTYFKEHQIHPSQEVEEISEGVFKISFECAMSSQISRLISSFGGHIISIEPPELDVQVKEIWSSGLEKAA